MLLKITKYGLTPFSDEDWGVKTIKKINFVVNFYDLGRF